MKCIYVKNLICDYPVETGDIICTTCEHYPHKTKTRVIMKCPYSEIECPYLNTSGMSTTKKCSDCEYYGKGIRPTGATPVLAWLIEKIKSLFR